MALRLQDAGQYEAQDIKEEKMIYERFADEGLKAIQIQLGCPSCFFGDPKVKPGFSMCTHPAPEWKVDNEKYVCLKYRKRSENNDKTSRT
jgi:hypothetical protein